MPKFKKVIPYKLRRILPVLGVAGAGMLNTACSKDEPQYKEEPLHDVILEFYETRTHVDYSQVESIDKLQELANDRSVRNIFMTVRDDNDYTEYRRVQYHSIRQYMEKRTDISPKIRGCGNFKFRPHQILEEDSLWFVDKGWTINQHLQNQK